MRHGDQVQDVQMVVGGADGGGLQVHGLLLIQGWDGQHQAHLGKENAFIIYSLELGSHMGVGATIYKTSKKKLNKNMGKTHFS